MTERERRRFRVTGVVQGVGFRPFVHGLAHRHELCGFVLNDGQGVIVEAEGEIAELDRFSAGLRDEAPPLARVDAVLAETTILRGDTEFVIEASATTGGGGF
ncbi:MAG: acylphosphatase [Gaiellaceae bacterium]